jgi:hypothetical protein
MSRRRFAAPFCAAAMALGFLGGCEAGSGEIKLASVPAPPEGFGKPNPNALKGVKRGITSPPVLPK